MSQAASPPKTVDRNEDSGELDPDKSAARDRVESALTTESESGSYAESDATVDKVQIAARLRSAFGAGADLSRAVPRLADVRALPGAASDPSCRCGCSGPSLRHYLVGVRAVACAGSGCGHCGLCRDLALFSPPTAGGNIFPSRLPAVSQPRSSRIRLISQLGCRNRSARAPGQLAALSSQSR